MRVPFIDLKAQLPLIREEIERRFGRIIDNTAFVCGKEVKEFEERFSAMHGAAFAVGLSSGTAGNHLAMLSSGIRQGDEVLVPVNTFIATAEGISLCGATPVFVDIDEETFTIDVDKIENKITRKTKAINPVHLYGQPADLIRIYNIAEKHNLLVIEDAAQAHFAEYDRIRIGEISKIASWSFYPGKNLGAWGEAGAITTNEEDIYRKVLKLRDHGSGEKYIHDLIGHNYRMSEFQAAVLNVKMEYLADWTERRIHNAELYSSCLTEVEQVIVPKTAGYAKHVFHLYVIRAKDRSGLQAFLSNEGISTGLHYPIPLHLTKAYSDLGYVKGDFPVAERIAEEILSLPMYPEMTEDQITFICDKIIEKYAR